MASIWQPGTMLTASNHDEQVAIDGQTVFNLPFTYELGGGALVVTIDGVDQEYNVAYLETSTTQVTFQEPLEAGSVVTFRGLV